jgi:hypothetical protein
MTKEEIVKEAINLSYVQEGRRFIRNSFIEEHLQDVPILCKSSYRFSYLMWNLYNPDDIIIQNSKFEIHHIDKDSLNDDIDNLDKLSSFKHKSLHNKDKVFSKETREKMSKSRKGKYLGKNNHFYGRKHTDKTKQLISKSSKNRVVSQETREKISRTLTGITRMKITNETREKMSKSHKGKIVSKEVKEKMAKSRKEWWRKKKLGLL